MDNGRSESELTKKHEDFVRQQNERCFLKDKQQVKYHSFILLEIIPLEKINQLFDGLDSLYLEVSQSESGRLNYRKILSDSHSKLFQTNTLYLPYIATLRLKGKIFPTCAFHDLGDNIQHMYISIYHILPSTAVLQIHVYLEDEISKKINGIIYEYHTEKQETIETPKGGYIEIYSPENQKKSEIYHLKQSLHGEAVNFLKKYFSGYFFELTNNDTSIVPSIDLFSLELPNKDDEVINWWRENRGFLRCLDTFYDSYTWLKYENYMFTSQKNDYSMYDNYLILANRTNGLDHLYPDVDTAIEENLNFCCFDLLAIDRLVKLQESNVGKFNLTVSQEIDNIRSNNFNKAIEGRKEILRTIFSFERFVAEFAGYWLRPDRFKFEPLFDTKESGKQMDLFKGLHENINTRIKEINALISLFAREHENVLNLKNLEFNKKMQDKVLWLTILILILTIIQIGPTVLEFIMKFFTWLMSSLLFFNARILPTVLHPF
jgi:hypothetical protein